jgi:hypothetical protein
MSDYSNHIKNVLSGSDYKEKTCFGVIITAINDAIIEVYYDGNVNNIKEEKKFDRAMLHVLLLLQEFKESGKLFSIDTTYEQNNKVIDLNHFWMVVKKHAIKHAEIAKLDISDEPIGLFEKILKVLFSFDKYYLGEEVDTFEYANMIFTIDGTDLKINNSFEEEHVFSKRDIEVTLYRFFKNNSYLSEKYKEKSYGVFNEFGYNSKEYTYAGVITKFGTIWADEDAFAVIYLLDNDKRMHEFVRISEKYFKPIFYMLRLLVSTGKLYNIEYND